MPELFYLDTPGIVLFDDFDAALRDRREAGEVDRWDWPWAQRVLRQRGSEPALRRAIGFSGKVTAPPEAASAVSARAKYKRRLAAFP